MTPQSIVPLVFPSTPGGINNNQSFVGAILELQTSATDTVRIQEIVVMNAESAGNTTNCDILLGVPAAKGVGVGGISPVVEDSGDTSVAPALLAYMMWSRQPTAPVQFFRRATLQSQNSTNIMPIIRFLFVRGLTMAPSSSFVIWTPKTNAQTTFDVQVLLDG